MAQNAADLCVTSLVEGDLSVSGDAKAQAAVTAVSKAIARLCGRVFERSASLTEYPASVGRKFLRLRRPPVVSVASITEFGAVVESAQYECLADNADAGLVLRKRAYGSWYPLGREAGGVTFTRDSAEGESGDLAYTVVYAGGFVTPGQNAIDPTTYPTVTVPEDLQTAARLWAVAIYKLIGADLRVSQEALGNWSVSYLEVNSRYGIGPVPAFVEQLFAPYILPWI